ncbi:hypothetical protein MLD38_024900 [Melastoma candidum]|uniref:Uncharacterized protein n=1 Tax=Melastoma candidum TaxID=119954 RepID=A0ACB9NV22_9MYRT|nr:hypothetical protein MLD38_024900 [Melastoma candidum]
MDNTCCSQPCTTTNYLALAALVTLQLQCYVEVISGVVSLEMSTGLFFSDNLNSPSLIFEIGSQQPDSWRRRDSFPRRSARNRPGSCRFSTNFGGPCFTKNMKLHYSEKLPTV